MEKNYKQFDMCLGATISEVVLKLIEHSVKNKGELVSCEFNGHVLYSDTASLDSAYQLITDKSYSQFNADQEAWHKDYEKKEEEHKDAIPEMTDVWIKKGHEILTEDKWDYWDKIVPIRLGDLYHGMELGCCLSLVEMLNKECSLDEAKKVIEDQNHSGMSYGLVRAMVREFCDRGNEFSEYVK